MNLNTEITILTALSAGMFLVGTLLILFYGPTLTIVGLVLFTAGTLAFLVDVTDVIGHWRRFSDE